VTTPSIFILSHAVARQRALDAVKSAPDGYVVRVGPPRRSLEQNSALYALISDIADRREWAGRKWDTEDWKRLLTAAWLRARGGHPAIIPAVDGKGFDVLYRHTSKLSKAEMSELIEFVRAWDAENSA
jgi:NinB protein